MPTGTIILLGAFAGLTIFLGLPLVFLKHLPQSLKVFLTMLATGILMFLLFDVLSKASEPINASLDEVRTHQTGTGVFSLNVLLLVLGIGLGSVGLVYFNRLLFGRVRLRTAPPAVAQASAGAILYVVAELLGQAKRERAPEIVMWGLLIVFLLGYVTDLLVTYAGA